MSPVVIALWQRVGDIFRVNFSDNSSVFCTPLGILPDVLNHAATSIITSVARQNHNSEESRFLHVVLKCVTNLYSLLEGVACVHDSKHGVAEVHVKVRRVAKVHTLLNCVQEVHVQCNSAHQVHLSISRADIVHV